MSTEAPSLAKSNTARPSTDKLQPPEYFAPSTVDGLPRARLRIGNLGAEDGSYARAEALTVRTPSSPAPLLGRRSLYRVRAAAKGEAEVTAGSQPPAAAARVKPEWTAFLEQLLILRCHRELR